MLMFDCYCLCRYIRIIFTLCNHKGEVLKVRFNSKKKNHFLIGVKEYHY